MLRLFTLLISVFLVANVVGCCLRGIGIDIPGSQAVVQSPSAPEASSPEQSRPETSSSPQPEAPSSSQPESSQAEPEPLPEKLTLEEVFSYGGGENAQIYISESDEYYTVEAAYAAENISRLGISELPRVEVADPLEPSETDYISVACGEAVFYILDGVDYGRLDVGGQTACYELPSGLYAKIQLAMLFF